MPFPPVCGLIESDWNLKKFGLAFASSSFGINRIRFEFKGAFVDRPGNGRFHGLIESDWNLKLRGNSRAFLSFLGLIESDWNLKLPKATR